MQIFPLKKTINVTKDSQLQDFKLKFHQSLLKMISVFL